MQFPAQTRHLPHKRPSWICPVTTYYYRYIMLHRSTSERICPLQNYIHLHLLSKQPASPITAFGGGGASSEIFLSCWSVYPPSTILFTLISSIDKIILIAPNFLGLACWASICRKFVQFQVSPLGAISEEEKCFEIFLHKIGLAPCRAWIAILISVSHYSMFVYVFLTSHGAYL